MVNHVQLKNSIYGNAFLLCKDIDHCGERNALEVIGIFDDVVYSGTVRAGSKPKFLDCTREAYMNTLFENLNGKKEMFTYEFRDNTKLILFERKGELSLKFATISLQMETNQKKKRMEFISLCIQESHGMQSMSMSSADQMTELRTSLEESQRVAEQAIEAKNQIESTLMQKFLDMYNELQDENKRLVEEIRRLKAGAL